MMTIPAPFDQYEGAVLPEWIDANGHMNLAYYVVLFDYATDTLFNAIGIGGLVVGGVAMAVALGRPMGRVGSVPAAG